MDDTRAALTFAATTEIAMAALSEDDPDVVLPLVVRHAAVLTDADVGIVDTVRADGRLTIDAVHAQPGVVLAGDVVGSVLSTRSAAARVARGGEPVVVEDLAGDPRTAGFVPPALGDYGPFAVVPFGTRQRRLGALAVYRRRGGPPFTPVALQVLTSFAAQAGLVLVLAEGTTARHRIAIYQERERIARDLHDVIVQHLYATGVQLDLLSRRLEGQLEPSDATRLVDAVDQLDQTIAEVRATVRALRSADPSTAANVPDLLDSVRADVDIAGELLGFRPVLEVHGDLARVPVALADHTRAALREALSNVVRHSGATSVLVQLRCEGPTLLLQVVDDGCGIPRGVTRRGLRHLEERAADGGGRCAVTSSLSGGTTVTWEVPLPTTPS